MNFRKTAVLCGVAGALAFAPHALAGDDDDEEEIPFAVAEVFFELNNTDGDLGIHALIDGDPWKRLRIEDPRDRKMLNVFVRGRLRRQGLTEIFSKARNPYSANCRRRPSSIGSRKALMTSKARPSTALNSRAKPR